MGLKFSLFKRSGNDMEVSTPQEPSHDNPVAVTETTPNGSNATNDDTHTASETEPTNKCQCNGCECNPCNCAKDTTCVPSPQQIATQCQQTTSEVVSAAVDESQPSVISNESLSSEVTQQTAKEEPLATESRETGDQQVSQEPQPNEPKKCRCDPCYCNPCECGSRDDCPQTTATNDTQETESTVPQESQEPIAAQLESHETAVQENDTNQESTQQESSPQIEELSQQLQEQHIQDVVDDKQTVEPETVQENMDTNPEFNTDVKTTD